MKKGYVYTIYFVFLEPAKMEFFNAIVKISDKCFMFIQIRKQTLKRPVRVLLLLRREQPTSAQTKISLYHTDTRADGSTWS